MTLRAKVGSFVNPVATGTDYSVTGIGFRPKWLMTLSADLPFADRDVLMFAQSHCVGFARQPDEQPPSEDDQVCIALYSLWNALLQGTNATAEANTAVFHEAFYLSNGVHGTHTLSSFVSFDADGFTLRSDNGFVANWHHYIALGGDTLVTEKFQYPMTPTSPGTQTITGASQRPTLAIFLSTVNDDDGEAPAGGTWAMGWYDGTRQGTTALQVSHFANPGINQQYQSAAHGLAMLDPFTGALEGLATATGFTDDGLTLEWTSAGPIARTMAVILLSGVTAECGAFLQPLIVGPQTVAVPTVDPRAIVLMSENRPASAAVADNLRLTMGMSDGATMQLGTYQGDNTGTEAPPNTQGWNLRGISGTAALTLAHPDGPGPGGGGPADATIDAQATISGFDSAGAFTVDWSLVDGAANEVLYLVFGPTPPPPPTPPDLEIVTIPQRRLRQSPHLSTEQVYNFYARFQLDFQAGVKVTDSPLMFCLQWSDDGGHVWSNEHWIEAGALGQYKFRAIWRRLGRSRDRVFRVFESNDAPIVWLDAFIDIEPGIS